MSNYHLTLDGVVLASYSSRSAATLALWLDSGYTDCPLNSYDVASLHDMNRLGICRKCGQITGREDIHCRGWRP